MKCVAMFAVLGIAIIPPSVGACGKGCEEFEGVCACDQAPFKAESVNNASDEKPRKEQIREWESGDVKADMPQNLIASDAKQDTDRMQADADGKRSAGIQ